MKGKRSRTHNNQINKDAADAAPIIKGVMFTRDDRDTVKIGDRLIATAIAAFLGFWLGGFFGIIALKFADSSYGLPWIVAAGFGIFAFIAPSRSTEIWSAFWEELLGFLSSRK